MREPNSSPVPLLRGSGAKWIVCCNYVCLSPATGGGGRGIPQDRTEGFKYERGMASDIPSIQPDRRSVTPIL
ncbi:hypothetical protein Pmani_013825 [Petrolisthes manimaculis]|uniref:Uncharacterized protein n=1 Tax=Petrolisthes manimaculis TaxID=1843537 RepID=A0AAE1PUA8_9EUCA|nr:hypothetical protein Pmani_013825 [Petrolisthes manimaculis]